MRSDYYPKLLSARRTLSATEKSRLLETFGLRVPMFHRLPKQLAAELAEASGVRAYAAGEFLCRPGDPARELWVLLKGRISIHRTSWNGHRVGIEILLPGDVFGLSAMLFGTYPNEILAARESVVASIPKTVMMKAIERCPELAREILLVFGQRLRFMETQLVLSRESAEKRIVAALLYLCHKFGPRLPLTRVELSEMSGTSPETTIRVLQRLTRRGGLRKAPGTLLCHVRTLKTMLEAEENPGPSWDVPDGPPSSVPR
ncbi:MAG TPA: Crp/Fnr family transcriptional regulator [Elusimicrobiota bacterium]|nr:Crp/Fnr family transcriptional regulator [Elusimicrobiota bacterium]